MTKTEKVKRAVKVRADLALYLDIQRSQSIREWYRRETGKPDAVALAYLMSAQKELAELIDLYRRDLGLPVFK